MPRCRNLYPRPNGERHRTLLTPGPATGRWHHRGTPRDAGSERVPLGGNTRGPR
ncbi:hypothetical protein [Streptomyces sp. NBC_00470]|uniref:hypothetical protein n=1 Tax=Streptomyces sp. NBC_00470 TaxID=2975753 RepID=UPI0030E56CE0